MPAYRKNDRSKVHYQIPCIFLDAYDPMYLKELEIMGRSPPTDKRILLYFHGNAEDVGNNMPLLYQFREQFGCSILAMEYPGYGFFTH
mgnify:CR=1 FL=1